ncbi:hypothetical protein FRX96_10085 (plasmid) [Spiroplasma citri]|nr:hypothetical protein FRX96_10085 [Spiroplasma citri]
MIDSVFIIYFFHCYFIYFRFLFFFFLFCFFYRGCIYFLSFFNIFITKIINHISKKFFLEFFIYF